MDDQFNFVISWLGRLNPWVGVAQAFLGIVFTIDLVKYWRRYTRYQIASRVIGALFVGALAIDRYAGSKVAYFLVNDQPLGAWGTAAIASRFTAGVTGWLFAIFVIGLYWNRKE